MLVLVRDGAVRKRHDLRSRPLVVVHHPSAIGHEQIEDFGNVAPRAWAGRASLREQITLVEEAEYDTACAGRCQLVDRARKEQDHTAVPVDVARGPEGSTIHRVDERV